MLSLVLSLSFLSAEIHASEEPAPVLRGSRLAKPMARSAILGVTGISYSAVAIEAGFNSNHYKFLWTTSVLAGTGGFAVAAVGLPLGSSI